MDPIVCQWSECGIVVNGPADLDFHWLQHLIEDPISCAWANCFHVFPARQSIEGKMLHLRQAHTSHRPFECDKCERKYVAESFLELHKFRIHEQKKNLCLCPFLDCNFNSEELLDLSGHCIEVHGADGLKSLIKMLDGNPADLLFPNDVDRSMQSGVPLLKQILLKSLLNKTADFNTSRPFKSDPADLPINLLCEPSTSAPTNQRYSPCLHVADTIEISPFETREFTFPTSSSSMLPAMSTLSSSVTSRFIQPTMAPLPAEGVPQNVPPQNMGYYMNFVSNSMLPHQPPMEGPASLAAPQQRQPPFVQDIDPQFQPALRAQNYGPPMAEPESCTPSSTQSVISIPVEKNGLYNVFKVDLSYSHLVIHKTVQVPSSPLTFSPDPRIQYSFYWKTEQELKNKQAHNRSFDPRLKRDRFDSSAFGDQKRKRIYFDGPKASCQRKLPFMGKRGRPRSPQGYRSGYQGKYRSYSPLEVSPERPNDFEERPKGSNFGFDEENERNRDENGERGPRFPSNSPEHRNGDKSYYRGQKNFRRSSRGRSVSRERGGYRVYNTRKYEETTKFVSKYAKSPAKSANSSPARRYHCEDGNSP